MKGFLAKYHKLFSPFDNQLNGQYQYYLHRNQEYPCKKEIPLEIEVEKRVYLKHFHCVMNRTSTRSLFKESKMKWLICGVLICITNLAFASNFIPVKVVNTGEIEDGRLALNIGLNENPLAPEMSLACFPWAMDFNLYLNQTDEILWGDIEPSDCFSLQKTLQKNYMQGKTSCLTSAARSYNGLVYTVLAATTEEDCH